MVFMYKVKVMYNVSVMYREMVMLILLKMKIMLLKIILTMSTHLWKIVIMGIVMFWTHHQAMEMKGERPKSFQGLECLRMMF